MGDEKSLVATTGGHESMWSTFDQQTPPFPCSLFSSGIIKIEEQPLATTYSYIHSLWPCHSNHLLFTCQPTFLFCDSCCAPLFLLLMFFFFSRLAVEGSFAFSFVEGVLVKAIREGKWVLLDEINLASAETLQRLSGLLEVDTPLRIFFLDILVYKLQIFTSY